MEKLRYVTFKSRKGWLVLTIILSCFLILYWFIKNKNYHMATTTTSVKGVLYKSATGTPIEGAMVMIAEGGEHHDIASQSDAQGTFFLPEIQVPGTYTLLINYSGESRKITVNITKDSILRIPL
jgi:hypothetical protein